MTSHPIRRYRFKTSNPIRSTYAFGLFYKISNFENYATTYAIGD